MTSTLSPLASQAVQQLARPNVWFGLSGHRVTGEAVAQHLEAAATLMERKNWNPQAYATGHHLWDAFRSTAEDGVGDRDTQQVARQVMQTLLRLVLRAPYVDCWLWSEHSSRTLEEVLMLCRTAAELARLADPAQPGTTHLRLS